MAAFIAFLRSECCAIEAFVSEVGDIEGTVPEQNSRIQHCVSHHPELKDYFEVQDMGPKATESYEVASATLREEYSQSKLWSSSLRLAIIEHFYL
jgi:hypothetical protein